MPPKTKEERIFQTATCILALEISKGHLKWKVTDLVRKSNMSRTLVYRYFGSNKKDILLFAIRAFNKRFWGVDEESLQYGQVPFPEKVKRARAFLMKYPEAVQFYSKWRSKDSFLKEEFINIEKKFESALKEGFPNLDEDDLRFAHACISGMVISPFISPDEAKYGTARLLELGVF